MACDKDISGTPWADLQIDLDFLLPFYGFRFNYTFVRDLTTHSYYGPPNTGHFEFMMHSCWCNVLYNMVVACTMEVYCIDVFY